MLKLFYSADTTFRELGARNFLIYSLQMLLAIISATIVVPITVGNNMSPTAALFGAGVGTLIYLLLTRGKSPVFLGSSHAFIGAMTVAFAGDVSPSLGYLGLLIGALAEGLVYLILSVVVKFCGTRWIHRVMPAVVVGPVVALIGLELAAHATEGLLKGNSFGAATPCSPYIALLCGLVALGVSIYVTVHGKKKTLRMFPFIIGVGAAYLLALLFTLIGHLTHTDALLVIDLSRFGALLPEGRVAFSSFFTLPDFAFLTALRGNYSSGTHGSVLKYVLSVLFAYVPIAFVVFTEHIVDHAHISTIVGRDLLTDPGLSRTLAGDGLGSIVGAFFSGCPNTSYSESVGCMAITGNTSTWTVIGAALFAILLSFSTPFTVFISTIPACIASGICMALYGFVVVAGLSMLEGKDLEEHQNMFPIAIILISGVGGISLTIGGFAVPAIASALVLGILTNLLVSKKKVRNGAQKTDIDHSQE